MYLIIQKDLPCVCDLPGLLMLTWSDGVVTS